MAGGKGPLTSFNPDLVSRYGRADDPQALKLAGDNDFPEPEGFGGFKRGRG